MQGSTLPHTNNNMLNHHLKIAWRQLRRNPGLSFINIFGLAAGLAAALLILVFVLHERSYDRMYPAANEIVRMGGLMQYGNQTMRVSGMSAGVGPALQRELPEVVNFVRVQEMAESILRRPGGPATRAIQTLLVDSNFFALFPLPQLPTDLSDRLAEPNQLILTERAARLYFGSEPAVGQTLQYQGTLDFTVAAVIPDPPSNTTLQYEALLSLETLRRIEVLNNPDIAPEQRSLNNTRFQLGNFQTYLQRAENSKLPLVTQKLNQFAADYAPTEGAEMEYVLEPLVDLHLHGMRSEGASAVRLATGIALLILLLALVNYFNLTTAGALRRAKATGIRKIVGSSRFSLLRQFYTESALVCILALLLAIALLFPMRTLLDRFLDVRIDASFYVQPLVIGSVVGLFAGLVLLAGAIPAAALSRFTPMQVLRNRFVAGPAGRRIRQGLILAQFIITTTLVLGGLTVQRQVNYLSNRDLGIQVDQVINIPVEASPETSFSAYRTALENLLGADRVTATTGGNFRNGVSGYFIESPGNGVELALMTMTVDPAFFDFFGLDWQVPASVDLQRAENTPLVLNERAVAEMGLDPARLSTYQLPLGNQGSTPVGVVENFNFQSPRTEVRPLALRVDPNLAAQARSSGVDFYAAIPPDRSARQVMQELQALHETAAPDQVFEYHFLDETFAAFYESESRLAQLIRAFTLLAILLSCLGLIGLSLYATQQRAREIGLRKVLGASAPQIVALLNRDFLRPVLLSLPPAFALAYYFLRDWLDNFHYRIDLSWWLFGLTAVIVVAVALLTVSTQSIRAAVANPVERLRE